MDDLRSSRNPCSLYISIGNESGPVLLMGKPEFSLETSFLIQVFGVDFYQEQFFNISRNCTFNVRSWNMYHVSTLDLLFRYPIFDTVAPPADFIGKQQGLQIIFILKKLARSRRIDCIVVNIIQSSGEVALQ
jgi:hypothetical protein